jgi:hypothetical protein
MKPIWLVRYGLPVAIATAGVVVIIVGSGRGVSAAAGITLIGVALLVLLVNWFARLSISSQDDRDEEQRARERRWPSPGRQEDRTKSSAPNNGVSAARSRPGRRRRREH